MLRIQPKEQTKDKKVEEAKRQLGSLTNAINNGKQEFELNEELRASALKTLAEIEFNTEEAKKDYAVAKEELKELQTIHQNFKAVVDQATKELKELELQKSASALEFEKTKELYIQELEILKNDADLALSNIKANQKFENDKLVEITKLVNKLMLQESDIKVSIENQNKILITLEQKTSDLDKNIVMQKQEIEKNKLLNESTSESVNTRQEALHAVDEMIVAENGKLEAVKALVKKEEDKLPVIRKELKDSKEQILANVKREERINKLIPELQEFAKKAGIEIKF